MRRTLIVSLFLFYTSASLADSPRIAIIIDDLGYHLANGKRAIELPGTVTYSFLPGSPRAKLLADRAHAAGREVLLHLPLQAYSADQTADQSVEPSEINFDMSQAGVELAFSQALDAVPHVVGINSHRGSLLTRHPGHMMWLMQEIAKREQLFFVDSFTTHHSVALQIAEESGVDATKRDVFLDPDRSPETVAREFERMKELAEERGQVVAIGHPYPSTLELLERELPRLIEEGFELVSVSEIVR